MRHVKIVCTYTPTHPREAEADAARKDWEMHPSWTAGMEALEDYSRWVSEIVLPVAFQWIEEHKAEVYATVPDELKDDVGVVMAAAFKLVKELPAYQRGAEQASAYEAARNEGTLESGKINPVWTGIAKSIRSKTKEAFAEHSSLLGETDN